MKINKAQFDDYLNRIRELVNSYINESNDYKYNNYMLFLANGEVIKYSFNDNNIPHLLGIDFTSLISRNEIDKNDSIDMLYQILDDPYKYWNIVNKTNSNELFSDYIEDKITNFRYQIMVPSKSIILCV